MGPVEDILADEGVSLDLELTDLEADADEDGDLLKLTIDNAAVEATASDSDGDYEGGILEIDGLCVRGTDDYGDSDESCIDGEVRNETGIDSYFLMLSKNDGGWQVDPLATSMSYGQMFIENVSSDLVDRAVRRCLLRSHG